MTAIAIYLAVQLIGFVAAAVKFSEHDLLAERTPYDGKPYFCSVCGMGFAEYMACEDGDCHLEDEAIAKARQEQKLKEARAH